MTTSPIRRSIVPEPILRAHLDFLSQILLRVRSQCIGTERISDEELFDLMDALHNIPEMLASHGGPFTHEVTRQYLVRYDDRWNRCLTRVLDEAIAREEKLAKPKPRTA